MARGDESCDGCPGYSLMSLDSMPPYVYCTGCKKPVRCKRCGAPTAGECLPEDCKPKDANAP